MVLHYADTLSCRYGVAMVITQQTSRLLTVLLRHGYDVILSWCYSNGYSLLLVHCFSNFIAHSVHVITSQDSKSSYVYACVCVCVCLRVCVCVCVCGRCEHLSVCARVCIQILVLYVILYACVYVDKRPRWQVRWRELPSSLLLHCCYTVVTLLLHCCYTAVTLSLHCCSTVVSLLFHCCSTVVPLFFHCCSTVVTLFSDLGDGFGYIDFHHQSQMHTQAHT
jgi:hypothetical protein